VWVRVLEIDESRRRISLSVKRAQPSQALPLRDLIPAEVTEAAEAAPTELPDLDVSDEVFPETGAPQEVEAAPSEPADEATAAPEPEAEAAPEPEAEAAPEPEAEPEAAEADAEPKPEPESGEG
jgi:hypothetical protein